MVISPGTYLRLRRMAAGMSIEDVAAIIGTTPHIGELARVDWVRRIEADQVPAGYAVICALRYAYAFDSLLLDRLGQRHQGLTVEIPQICHACGCSEHDPCRTLPACGWVAPDLCSRCAGEPAADAARIAA